MDNCRQFIIIFIFAMIVVTCRLSIAKTLEFSCIEETPDIEISRLVLAEAYGRLGIEIKIQELPGLRALKYANEGLTDGELFRAAGIEAEYVNLIRIHVPINTVDVVVITKNISFEVTGWQSLKPYHIGVQSGITFIESSISKMEGLNVSRVKSSSQLLRMLNNERIDAVVAPRISALLSLTDQKFKTMKILEPPLQILPLFHYLSKKHQALAPELENVLHKMEADGEIKRIRDEYILNLISE
jgi:polar amino acid transport system substrate-binding protein